MKTILPEDIETLTRTSQISMGAFINALEEIFRLYGKGQAMNTHKHVKSTTNPYHVHIELGAKIPEYELLKVIDETKPEGKTEKDTTITLYHENETFVLKGDFITDTRTGIAGALAAKYLVGQVSKIAIIGAGKVPRQFALAAEYLFHPEEIRFATRSESSRKDFEGFLRKNTQARVKAYDIYNAEHRRELLKKTDLLFEAAPLDAQLRYEEITLMNPHAHISSMTGDGLHHNFEAEVLRRCAIIVDDEASARKSGELRHVPAAKILGTIGEASLGKFQTYRRERTFYDSTGMGISDLIAKVIVEKYR